MFEIPNIDIAFDKKKKQHSNLIDVRNLVMESYNPLTVNPTHPTVKVRFAENSINSINVEDIKFSNMLPKLDEGALDTYIVNAFQKIIENSETLKAYCTPIDYSGKHVDRIKKILCNYMDEDDFEICSDYFRKSDIRTGILLQDRGAFRVISLYHVEPKTHRKQKNSKHYLTIICIDPYHLFIPSKDYGLSVYETVKNHTLNISDKYPNLYK